MRVTEESVSLGLGNVLVELGSVSLLALSMLIEASFNLVSRPFAQHLRTTADQLQQQETMFFLGGFLAPEAPYYGVCAHLARSMRGKIRIHIPRIGTSRLNINCLPFNEARERLEEEYQRYHPKLVGGHSLGGIYAADLAARHPELQVITLGSPIWGTPWTPLAELVRGFTGIDQDDLPLDLLGLRESMSEFGTRITTIANTWDPIAPPERCKVEGATNIVIDPWFVGHGGLVLAEAALAHVRHRMRRTGSPQIHLASRERSYAIA